MITQEQLDELLKGTTEAAHETIRRFKNHPFVALAYFEDEGKLAYSPLPLDPILADAERLWEEGFRDKFESAKDFMADLVKARLKKLKAFGVIMFAEAWRKHLPRDKAILLGGDDPSKGGGAIAPNPRDFEDKVEILMMHWEFKMPDGKKVAGVRQWEIFRNGTIVTLGKGTDSPDALSYGRFVNLLP